MHMVRRIHRHPGYQPHPKSLNDIAILEIKNEIVFTPAIQPICLPQPNHRQYVGDIGVALGWGSEYFKGPPLRILQEISIKIWDNIKCQEAWKDITKRTLPSTMLCAGGELGKDACQGDSGGPLNCYDPKQRKWELCGIVSFGYRCGTALPGIYTRVTEYLEWISTIIANEKPYRVSTEG